jgi:putative ABC transport system permease protein
MQKFLEAAKIALQAIWSAKLRSFLTVLGNIVAVTSIIAVVSLIQGFDATVKSAIQSSVGADAFTVQQFGIALSEDDFQKMQSNPKVTLDDAAAIRAYSPNVALVMAESDVRGEAKFRGQSLDSVSIQGVTKEYVSLPTTNIEHGRPITPAEFDAGRYVAVIGWDIADKLFGPLDPIDKVLSLEGVRFTVVGVAAKKGSVFGASQDEFVVIPLEAFQHVFGYKQRGLSLTVRPKDVSLVKTAMDDATVALRIERRLRPKQPDNFGISSADTFLDLYNTATRGIVAVLVGVVSLSLVVGGIVIMNIMLMVVSERTREIGLRKSLGARRRDILWQILTESITLSTFGGIVGTVLGFVLAFVISSYAPFKAVVQPWAVALGVSMTSIVGLFFGLYPAMRAAALDPIEALRRE